MGVRCADPGAAPSLLVGDADRVHARGRIAQRLFAGRENRLEQLLGVLLDGSTRTADGVHGGSAPPITSPLRATMSAFVEDVPRSIARTFTLLGNYTVDGLGDRGFRRTPVCETHPRMRVLSIVHERTAGSGVFAEVARAHHAELVEWMPALGGAPSAGEFDAALVFGGATHADQELEYTWLQTEKQLLRELLLAAVPTLGVCLGAQLVAEVAGGGVVRMPAPEIGWTPVQLTAAARADALLGPLPRDFESFQWHSYEVLTPGGAVALARSAACLQAFRLASAPWWGIQFHAEATSETIAGWIEDYRSDPDAVRAERDWAALLAQTRREFANWNELGVGICERFLRHARTRACCVRR